MTGCRIDSLDACPVAADCVVRGRGVQSTGPYTGTQHVNEKFDTVSVCLSLFHAADGVCVCAAGRFPRPPPRRCHAVKATALATTVKSQLAHSPPSSLTPRSHLPSCLVYDIAKKLLR